MFNELIVKIKTKRFIRRIARKNKMDLKNEMKRMANECNVSVNAELNKDTGNLIITIGDRDIELTKEECVIVLITLGAIFKNDRSG